MNFLQYFFSTRSGSGLMRSNKVKAFITASASFPLFHCFSYWTELVSGLDAIMGRHVVTPCPSRVLTTASSFNLYNAPHIIRTMDSSSSRPNHVHTLMISVDSSKPLVPRPFQKGINNRTRANLGAKPSMTSWYRTVRVELCHECPWRPGPPIPPSLPANQCALTVAPLDRGGSSGTTLVAASDEIRSQLGHF